MKIDRTMMELVLHGHSKELYRDSTYAGRILLQSSGYTGRYMPIGVGRHLKIKGIKSLPPGVYTGFEAICKHFTGMSIEEHLYRLNMPGPEYNWQKEVASVNLELLACKRHKDIRLKGAGKFRYPLEPGDYRSLRAIRLRGYLNTTSWRVDLSNEEIVRLVKINFPRERVDELRWAKNIDFINIPRDSLTTILSRLDEIVLRGLQESYYDDKTITYTAVIVEAALRNRLIMPENGKALKQAALHFKNCAANYVEAVSKGQYFILYDGENMAGLKPNGTLMQWFGKRNGPPTKEWIA